MTILDYPYSLETYLYFPLLNVIKCSPIDFADY